jgi:hypothetical protein
LVIRPVAFAKMEVVYLVTMAKAERAEERVLGQLLTVASAPGTTTDVLAVRRTYLTAEPRTAMHTGHGRATTRGRDYSLLSRFRYRSMYGWTTPSRMA